MGYIEVTCTTCHGSGVEDVLENCPNCHGRGSIPNPLAVYGFEDENCSRCKGDGKIKTGKKKDCWECHGRGTNLILDTGLGG